MVVISSAELRNNMEKYLDIAKVEKVVIQRGRTEVFVLSTPQDNLPDDFSSAITAEELLIGIEADIKEIFQSARAAFERFVVSLRPILVIIGGI